VRGGYLSYQRRTVPRPRTLARRALAIRHPRKASLDPLASERELDALEKARPACRPDCADVPRPCPFVSCKFNLYLDVNEATGSIKFNFPHLEPGEMVDSCVLDVVDANAEGVTLEAAGALLNITRERVRQIEVRALGKLEAGDVSVDEVPEPPPGRWAAIEAQGEDIRADDGDGRWLDTVRLAWERFTQKMRNG
jgi:hypothetical protein